MSKCVIARNLDDQTLLVHALGGGALPFAGGMATLLAMETPDLARELHLGPAGAQRFAAAVELGRRAAVAEVELPKSLCGGGDVAAWLRPRVAGEHTECFYAIYLTAKGGVVVAICDELQIPVRYVGIGEQVDYLRFLPEPRSRSERRLW